MHVHVTGYGGDAKFEYDEENFVLTEMYNIKANDLRKIKRAIFDNKQLIISKWINYFGKEATANLARNTKVGTRIYASGVLMVYK